MGSTEATVVIDGRFNGPPDSGNGGYVSGLLGTRLEGPAEVTLRVPPPLERPLAVVRDEQVVRFEDGDALVAEAVPARVGVEPPMAVALDEAERATAGYPGFRHHHFPTCFVCGPERGAGDGLRLFPGPVDGAPVSAAPWVPAVDLGDGDGIVAPEFVWASLDCPSYFGGVYGRLAVLGRLAVDIRAPVRAGQPHVVLGWGRGSEGRKHHAAAAVTTPDGELLAVSRATWIEPRG